MTAAIGVIVVGIAMAAPAAAHVAEVTASVPLVDVSDAESLRRTISEAVDKARLETIAFEPSLVAVTGVRVLGERLLIGLLFADDDGRAVLENLQGADEGARDQRGGTEQGGRGEDEAPGVGGLAPRALWI